MSIIYFRRSPHLTFIKRSPSTYVDFCPQFDVYINLLVARIPLHIKLLVLLLHVLVIVLIVLLLLHDTKMGCGGRSCRRCPGHTLQRGNEHATAIFLALLTARHKELLSAGRRRGGRNTATADTVQNCGPIVFMLSKMAVQVGLLSKAALAEVALVGLLLVVDIADMALQVGGDGEGSLAELTLVGLLAGVGAQVPRQVGRARERFAAIFAPEIC